MSASSSCSSRQTDCDGNDLTNVPGNSAADCCTACQAHAGCGAAVFVQDWNTCYLKTSCIPKSGCGGSSCTAVTIGDPPTCSSKATDCDGEDIANVPGYSP